LVKIADFGLSDFYRPGALIKSSCGTLSFLAPEVFRGTANAGPPLDVWALGVILFALLCGRLPFEGTDLIGTKRPRDAVIKARIMKCQFKLDDNLGPESKDLLRRMLQLDPAERITVPEIFNHVWVRVAANHWGDNHILNSNSSSAVTATAVVSSSYGSPASYGILQREKEKEKEIEQSISPSPHSDIFSPFSPAQTRVRCPFFVTYIVSYFLFPRFFLLQSKRKGSNPSAGSTTHESSLSSFSSEFKLKREFSSEVPTSAFNSKQSSRNDLDGTGTISTPGLKNRSHSSEGEDSLDIIKEMDLINLTSNNSNTGSNGNSEKGDDENSVSAEPKLSTIKLIPLRRNNGDNKQSKGGGTADDEDLLYISKSSSSSAPSSQKEDPNSNQSQQSFRPSTTIATSGRRQMAGLQKPSNNNNHDDSVSPSGSHVSSPAIPSTTKNFSGYAKEILRAPSPKTDGVLSPISDGKEKDSLYTFAMQNGKISSSSSTNSLSEIRRPSLPPPASSDSISPVPKSLSSSGNYSHHRKDMSSSSSTSSFASSSSSVTSSSGPHNSHSNNHNHNRVLPAGLASIQSHNTVLKLNSNNHSPSHHHGHHHDGSSTSSPSTSPLVTNIRKQHNYNNSPSQSSSGLRGRFT
jgi:serine/threonine protein kinase